MLACRVATAAAILSSLPGCLLSTSLDNLSGEGGGGAVGTGAGGSIGAPGWSRSFGDAQAQNVRAMAAAPDGSLLVGGEFGGVLSFDAFSMTATEFVGGWAARFDGQGNARWAFEMGTAGFVSGAGFTTGGDMLIAGAFLGTMNLGTEMPFVAGGRDIFVARMNPDGGLLWARHIPGSNSDSAYAMGVSADGRVAITGDLSSASIDFGAGVVPLDGEESYVAVYDTQGEHSFSHVLGGSGWQSGGDVAFDSQGNLIATGGFEGRMEVAGVSIQSPEGNSPYLIAFDRNGDHLWDKVFDNGVEEDFALAIGPDDSFVIAGNFTGEIDFGGGPLVSDAGPDIFVAAFSSTGEHRFSRDFGSDGMQSALDVIVTPSGHIAVTGLFEQRIAVDGIELVSAGLEDIFVLLLASDGRVLDGEVFGSVGKQQAVGIGTDQSGALFLAGHFEQSMRFGDNALTSAGLDDIFVARLGR